MSWNVHLPDAEWYTPGDHRIGAIVAELLDQSVVALDTETTGLNIVKDMPLYWSLAWGNRRVCMPASTLPFFSEVYKKRSIRWIFANAKYDMHILANVGIELAGDCCDSQVMHALLYEEQPHGLKDMAREVLGWKWTDFKETFGITKGMSIQDALRWMEQNNLQKLIEYASNDAYGTLKIYEKLKSELEESKTYSLYPQEFATMADIFFKTEMPFTRVLWKCERNGITVNADYLRSISGPAEEDLARIEREIVQTVGRMLNPNSTPQLRAYFIDELKLRPLTYTKGGKSGVKAPCVDANFLEHYKNEVPAAKLLLDYRELDKLKGTYIDGLQTHMDPFNRIHTRFNQDIARTGRLSSADPNLQNIPNADNDKFKLRGAFIPPPGQDLIVVDYEALEMRLLAAAAMDPLMTQIFLDRKDIHMGNAAMVLGRKNGVTYEMIVAAKKMDKAVKEGKEHPSKFTADMAMYLRWRAQIKNVAFGLNYGMRARKMARDLNIAVEEAGSLIEEYMATYPAVKTFFEEAVRETEQSGYSYTVIGRRRFHPEILSRRDMERFEAQRKAVNNNIQGTAADVVRWAMLNIDAAQLDYHYGCKMLLQVHDELVFECPKETVKEVKVEIKKYMEHPFWTDLAVPLTVSIGSGDSWLNAK